MRPDILEPPLSGRCVRQKNVRAIIECQFCDLEISPAKPVTEWPGVAGQTKIERGSLQEWRRLARAVEQEPISASGLSGAEFAECIGSARVSGIAK